MSQGRRQTAERIRALLDTEGDAVFENATHFNARREAAVAEFDRFEALRDEARAIKEAAIDRLPELLDQLRAAVEANGGHLHLADDAAEANRYVEEVVTRHGAEIVVKSKSMTTEEIRVNDHLKALGVDVFETDLGEFVLQVADEAPSHLIAPAIHRSTGTIAELFNRAFEPDEPFETAEQLTRFARDYLGERIVEADVGMTGANFLLAESGTLVLVTNEGNARKCAATPPVHIAVAGIEKVLPSIRELGPFVELIARSGTGQRITQYVSLLTPPVGTPALNFSEDGSPGDAREFHLVLVDNGRWVMRDDDDLRETLYCIRCGACANSCANFQHVGGHAFGGETYTGGIATGWEAGVSGLASAATFNDLCTGCSRCVNACPVKIDIPWINTVVRDRVNRGADPRVFDPLVEGLVPDAEPGGLDPGKRLFGNIGTVAKVASATAPVSNWLAGVGPIRAGMDRWIGIDRRRRLPRFRRQTLRGWYARRGPQADNPEREVVLYPDVYTDHVRVGRGKAAVRVFEALGVGVSIPHVPESGRAPLSQGMIATARRQAGAVQDALREDLEAGRDIVVIEPSDLAMFRREYGKLLDGEAAARLAEATHDAMAYVHGLLEAGRDPGALSSGEDRLAYHGHCQARTLGVDAYAVAVLHRLGYDVLTSDVECCGMAGSFGYKSAYYELSVDVGEALADQFRGTNRRIVAGGTSCMEQLESLLGRPAVHPVEVIDPARGGW